ncbi:cytochrome oxidase subunit II [Providencia rustigianii DSM 4541]|uniref:Cytochrome oxidase subunit II n=1 Tax=Providencia rustigianii DSM 4541 TaxID=500637 RepID=D1NY01_9GAMM|nr:cytochrome oxidase subunit II [Providencia rustigianii DSM 4541]SUC26801.1 Cytochrome d ubiquinol oxidase subunit 2 [Providencia rustigianii]
MGIDLPLIWFVIIVFSMLMYIVMDGFDLGIGILYPALKDSQDRDLMMNSVAPVWDGNETWLVLGGAALFGAFPLVYAIVLDALSIPLTFMLLALIFRGVAFEFRFRADESHRRHWDHAFIWGSIFATFKALLSVHLFKASTLKIASIWAGISIGSPLSLYFVDLG